MFIGKQRLLILFVAALLSLKDFAQKKPIDYKSLDQWEWFSERKISNNGEWICYGVGPANGVNIFYIKNMKTGKLLTFPNGKKGSFTKDNQRLYFTIAIPDQSQLDTMVIVNLNSLKTIRIPKIKELKISDYHSSTYAYTLVSGDKLDTLHIFYNNETQEISNVLQFSLTPEGKDVIYQKVINGKSSVIWRHINSMKEDTILSGINFVGGIQFSRDFSKLTFTWKEGESTGIAFYENNGKLIKLSRQSIEIPDTNYTIALNSVPEFSFSGKRLFFSMLYDWPFRKKKLTEEGSPVIWSYTDGEIQSIQKKQLSNELSKTYSFLWLIEKNQVLQLSEISKEELKLGNTKDEDFGLLTTSNPYRSKNQWDPDNRYDAYVINLESGKRKQIASNKKSLFSISPSAKYVVWFDMEKQHYFSYEMKTGINRQIDKGVVDILSDKKAVLPKNPDPYGISIWEEDDRSVIINTASDVWKLDPKTQSMPINLTLGLGKKEDIKFSYYTSVKESPTFRKGDTLLFFGENNYTKYAGFFALYPDLNKNPERLLYGPFCYTFPGMAIAKDKHSYVLSYGSTDFYGLFYSCDLQHFDTLYLLNKQQKEYNWYQSQLIRWKTFDGKKAEGVLYKPENFSSNKKYPMIVWVYENDDAKNLYSYRIPKWSGSIIDWTYYTSNGYLIFVPDIQYNIGKPGESAYNTIMSGILNLERNQWLDTSRIGLQGHSWGGYQVAYLITRTNKFKAASAGALVCDLISSYGEIRANEGQSRYWVYERHWGRIGATLWQKPQSYIENSPLFKANKITTPLLMMHNENDGIVPFDQSIEFFLAMKRLNKKAWLLNYPGENHTIKNLNNKKDFTLRMQQFFDYYLKNSQAPEWMVKGISALQQGYTSGLQLLEDKIK
jgi:dipeptidyl aminopeptidase/acylaminoacyl peptidase